MPPKKSTSPVKKSQTVKQSVEVSYTASPSRTENQYPEINQRDIEIEHLKTTCIALQEKVEVSNSIQYHPLIFF